MSARARARLGPAPALPLPFDPCLLAGGSGVLLSTLPQVQIPSWSSWRIWGQPVPREGEDLCRDCAARLEMPHIVHMLITAMMS